MKNIDSCDKESIIVTKNQFLTQKSSLITRNQFLPQEINSCHKKSVLVNSHPFGKLFYQFATTCESYQKIRLSFIHFVGTRFPGSQVSEAMDCIRQCFHLIAWVGKGCSNLTILKAQKSRFMNRGIF